MVGTGKPYNQNSVNDLRKPCHSKGWFSPAHKHKHNANEDSSNIRLNISMKHKNRPTCFSYVVLTRNRRNISTSIITRRTDMFVFFPSEDNMFFFYVYAYVAAVLTSVMLRLVR